MKSGNRENTNRGLLLVLSLALPVILGTCHGVKTQEKPGETFVFEGTLEKLAPDLGILSGRIAVYRLAKYRVQKVCGGKYEGKEIVVDHLVLDGKEFEGVEIGDRVCVTVRISAKILPRYNADGIRNSADSIKTFFIVEEIRNIDAGRSCCGISRE